MAKTTANHYQEWEVKIAATKKGEQTVYTAEKLKLVRPCVKISDQEAEVLNSGVLTGGNTYAKMYYKAEEGSDETPKQAPKKGKGKAAEDNGDDLQ